MGPEMDLSMCSSDAELKWVIDASPWLILLPRGLFSPVAYFHFGAPSISGAGLARQVPVAYVVFP